MGLDKCLRSKMRKKMKEATLTVLLKISGPSGASLFVAAAGWQEHCLSSPSGHEQGYLDLRHYLVEMLVWLVALVVEMIVQMYHFRCFQCHLQHSDELCFGWEDSTTLADHSQQQFLATAAPPPSGAHSFFHHHGNCWNWSLPTT